MNIILGVNSKPVLVRMMISPRDHEYNNTVFFSSFPQPEKKKRIWHWGFKWKKWESTNICFEHISVIRVRFNYIIMRRTASPTAEMETSVPMQYLITSYLAASSWALNAWISCNKQIIMCYQIFPSSKTWREVYMSKGDSNTLSSLFVRFVVSEFWLASSSRIRL